MTPGIGALSDWQVVAWEAGQRRRGNMCVFITLLRLGHFCRNNRDSVACSAARARVVSEATELDAAGLPSLSSEMASNACCEFSGLDARWWGYQGHVEVSYALRSVNSVCPSRNNRLLR
jgi:hypothetical protein